PVQVANLGEYIKGLGAEVDRTPFVVAFPGQHLLAHVPLDREPLVRDRRCDLGDLADSDNGLCGEIGNQLDVLVRKGTNFLAIYANCTNQTAPLKHRDHEITASAS